MKSKNILLIAWLLVCVPYIYAQQQITVTGVVTDKTYNEPVIGATVIVKGTTSGQITNVEGQFSIQAKVGDVLSVSYIGYVPQTATINGQQTNYDFVLAEDAQTLDEIVVVGFGTQKKLNLTGAVSTVDNKALESRPVSQVGQALQGVVPGLYMSVNNVGGALGNAMNVNIRGTGTIGEGSNDSPLILIDGIAGDMNALNPDDIENISVLKDAAASSVYGSRAPFGVILITTKSGKNGKAQVNYSNNFRWATATNLPDMMDSYTFAMYFNAAAANGAETAVFNDETIGRIQAYQKGELATTTVPNPGNGMYEFHQKANDNQNWARNHFKTAFTQEHNLNISGGTDKLNYYMSGAFMDQGGNLRYGDDNFQRINASVRVGSQVTNWLKVGINSRFIRETLDRPLYADDSGLYYHDISRTWPTMPLQDPNGHYMRNSKIIQIQDGGRHNRNKDITYTQGTIDITPLKGWNIRGELGLKTEWVNREENLARIYEWNNKNEPVAMAFNGSFSPGATYASVSKQDNNLLTTNLYTDYVHSLGKNNFKVMVGFNSELYKENYVYARRDDVISDQVPSIDASMGKDYTSAWKQEWATAGFFGRLNYDYDGRYLLEVNLRYDGSSRFIGDKRWNVFPSFSLGYNIAREAFWESLADYVNTLKPRVSWGKLGNQNTRAYYPFYLSQPLGLKNGNWLIGGEQPTTATAPLMVSNLMTWEKVSTLNIGFDFGAFNNRLTGSFEWYKRNTDDMIGPPEEKSSIIGIDTGSLPRINNAAMVTRGWELALTWNDRIGKLGYTVGLTLADARSKITKYPNESFILSSPYIGKYTNEIWGYETIGIAKTDEEMQAHLAHTDQSQLGSQWGAGDIMYKDLDGDNKISTGAGTVDDPGDRKIIGNSTPRYHIGITLGADWNGFDFRAFFQGVGKRDFWLTGNYFWGATGGMWQSIGYKEHQDYWRPEGDKMGANPNAYFPKPYFNTNKNQQVQTGYLQDASYLRLKNLQIGYTIPTQLVQRIGLSRVRVFFSGDNLFTFTSVFGAFDPEAIGGDYGNGKIYPISRTISCGMNVTF
ncbi:TonB-dependent receptor [Bacteroides sp. 519]|uniref:SusC/RagA family TonB-linked outer membrane protein n=1 Tax=Bacteroides sp. 519 TaxID=2302937 RepID=UPI0013D4CD33|nr:TonB-dependent receptor [Bacteroides sp. 519]NDV60416.1 TonB-dependent receptor [Bacteroides sp. 519]